jgi:hypothetical protein
MNDSSIYLDAAYICDVYTLLGIAPKEHLRWSP